jgi:signal transduction histidine kinase
VAPEQLERDQQENDSQDKINGDVANFLFERLGIKTTQITCRIDKRGKTITTELRDRGTLIYRLVELNTKYQELRDIKVKLFYLNRSAKVNFRKIMGMQPVQFGSVFLYKNGFRVQPYGTEGDDGFDLDRRKQQGLTHYLGTRDLLGRLEIQADNTRFKEVSSRDGGLQNSPELDELMEFFRSVPLKRLQTYVIDVIRWAQPPKGSDSEDDAIRPHEVRSEILELIKGLTDAKEVIEFESDPDIVRIVTERQAEGAAGLLSNLERMAEEKNNPELAKEARRLKREMKKALEARAAAQKEMEKERGIRILQEKQLETERKRNQFLKSLVSPAEEQNKLLQHWVKVVSERIHGTAEKLMGQLRRVAPQDKALAAELAAIVRDSTQLITVSELVSHGGFGIKKTKITGDLARYAFEYLSQMAQSGGVLEHQIAYDTDSSSQTRFQPVEIVMIVDNLISNAKKVGARCMEWQIDVTSRQVRITVANDGKPMNEKIQGSLFELGASATGGTGIGLFTCREILRTMGGEITFVGNDKRLGGARFQMTFPL